MFRLMLLGRPLKSDDPLDLGAAMRKVLRGYRGNKLETAVCIAASLAFNFMNWATTALGEQLTGHRIN
jgi:hypothetical protein